MEINLNLSFTNVPDSADVEAMLKRIHFLMEEEARRVSIHPWHPNLPTHQRAELTITKE